MNPLTRLRLEPERRTHSRILPIADEPGLLAAAPHHARNIVIASLYTGMRRGELLAQRWDDVDLANRVLYVTRSKTPSGESREIPLANRIYEMFSTMPRVSEYVFTYHGAKLSEFKRSWKTATTVLPYKLRFHDLRHTFNTRLVKAGIIEDVRRDLMGHSLGRSINWRYTHIDALMRTEAIQRLEDWVYAEEKKINSGGSVIIEASP